MDCAVSAPQVPDLTGSMQIARLKNMHHKEGATITIPEKDFLRLYYWT